MAAIIATLITDPLEPRFEALTEERLRPISRSVALFASRSL